MPGSAAADKTTRIGISLLDNDDPNYSIMQLLELKKKIETGLRFLEIKLNDYLHYNSENLPELQTLTFTMNMCQTVMNEICSVLSIENTYTTKFAEIHDLINSVTNSKKLTL